MSGIVLEWLPVCNPKLEYSHTITHDTATLGDLGQQPIALVPQKYLISS